MWQISMEKSEKIKFEYKHQFKIQCAKSKENAVIETKSISNL